MAFLANLSLQLGCPGVGQTIVPGACIAGQSLLMSLSYNLVIRAQGPLQVLDSIGVDLGAQLGSAPKTKLAAQTAPQRASKESDEELVSRLAALK